jgi:hypothetical protein
MFQFNGYDSGYQSNYQPSYDMQFVFYDEDEEEESDYEDFSQALFIYQPWHQQTKSLRNTLSHHH